MRRLPAVLLLGLVVGALPAAAVPADYSQLERCVAPGGASPVYSKWIGAVERALSFISQTKLNLALEVGKDRGNKGTRTVNIFKLKRVGDSGLLEAVPAERDDFFPDVLELVMTNDVDSFLLEFIPTQPVGLKESCVLNFGNVWTWASRPGATFPWAPRREAFTADRLHTTAVKDLLYRGQDGQPERLRLEPLKEGAPPLVPVAVMETDPGSPLDWDGKSNSLTPVGNATLYNLWLCSPGPALVSRPTCLGLVQYKLNDDPLVIRARSDIGLLKQTASIRTLENGQLTTYALLGSPAATSTRTFEYGGLESPVLPEGVRGNFVKSERALEYTVVLTGSADADRLGRRCPTDISTPPTQVRIFSGGSSSAFDVNACLYVRDSTTRTWQLVPDAPEGDAPEQRLLGAVQFSLCSSSTECSVAGFLGARTQMGFRVNGRATTIVLQATSVHDSPMPFEPATVTVTTLKPVYLPRLPAAALSSDSDVPQIELRNFDKSEWEAQKGAACIEGDWRRQYGADTLDAGAVLRLRGGPKETVIGDGRWKVATVVAKEFLCPELTDAQVQQLLLAVRNAVLSGQVAELDAVQGGQLVGRHVLFKGPARVPVASMEMHLSEADGGGAISAFTHRSALPILGSVCALTEADWGEVIRLDPSRFAIVTDAGWRIATFHATGADPGHFLFSRHANAPRTFDGKLWRYCAPVTDGELPGAAPAIIMTRPRRAGLEVRQIWLSMEDAEGCFPSGGSPHSPCTVLQGDAAQGSTGGDAISAYHLGVSWGHEYSTAGQVPPTEVRFYMDLPLLAFEVHPPGWFSFTTDMGLQASVAGGRALIHESFVTRFGVPIGGYASLCINLTGLRAHMHASPQICGGAFIDFLDIDTRATSAATGGKIGVDGPAFVPFVALGLGEF